MVKVWIELPEDINLKVEELAKEERVSFSAIVRQGVDLLIEKRKKS